MIAAGWILAAAIAVQGPVQAAGPDLSEAYFLFLQGRHLEGDGDTAGAVAAYLKALELAPEAAEIRAELAALYARQGRAQDAVAEAEAALRLDDKSREAHRILGFVKSVLADRPGAAAADATLRTDAIRHFERALAGNVRDPGAELTLGRLYVRNRQFTEAIRQLTTFLLDQTGFAEGLQLLAEAYEGAGRPADAAGVLSELVASQPDQSRLRAWLAELYEQSGQWPRAVDTWRDLAESDGNRTQYRLRHATALVNGGQPEAGRQALLGLTRDDPSNVSAWYLLSQVEARAGRADDAERAARQIIALDADDPRGVIALAEALAVRGDHAGIVSLLDARVQAPTPADLTGGAYPRMAGELAAARQAMGDSAGAVRVLEVARAHAPADPLLLFELGAAYERDDRSADAEQAFRQIIEREPANADALNYLGYMLADRGEKLDEAVELIQRALGVDADNPSYLDSLGWAYTQRGDLALAVEPLERAASALPRTSVIQDHLGDLYLRLERYRDAAAAYERALSGDRQGVDAATVARKRDRARELAGGR